MSDPVYAYAPSHQRGDSKLPLLPGELDGLPLPASPSSTRASSKLPTLWSIVRQRRVLIVGLAFASILSLVILSSVTVLGSVPGAEYIHTELASQTASNGTIVPPTAAITDDPSTLLPDEYQEEEWWSPAVLGPPTQRFRDNLRNDTKYITSWISAGWSMCP